MHRKTYKIALVSIILVAAIIGCTKKWDNHDGISDSQITTNLYQNISKTAGLAVFSSYLQKTGYDKVLATSKTYTVWVPTDAALASLDAATIADSAKLSQFVGNHICNQAYTAGTVDTQRIQMLNGKFNILYRTKFDSANITLPNQYSKNGLFHVIDKFIPRINSNWEFLNATTAAPLMKAYLLSLNYFFFDSTKGVQTGIDPTNGLPIYQPGTGIIQKNIFLNGKPSLGLATAIPAVMDVSDESNQYTVFLLADGSFTTEFNKLTPYFKTSTTDSTNALTSMYLVKDLAFSGAYAPNILPDTLVSQYGVKVPVNKSNIISATKTSNGWVYVMGQVNFNQVYKFPSIIVQGENPSGFSNYSSDFQFKTYYRLRQTPTGTPFKDILIVNAGVSAFYARYNLPNMASMRYNAYWVVVNDWQTTTWNQRLAIDNPNAVNFPYQTIASSATPNYNEISLGQFTLATFKTLNLYAVASATGSTSSGAQLSLDYIRLEPAF